jgi:molybdate transport system regulatory protein
VVRGEEIVLGPGKADLLEAVDRTGSLRLAADELAMSYMRAWSLVRAMNRSFREPPVELSRGGRAHGGACLTSTGKRIVSLYREMERASREATSSSWRKLRGLLRS